MRKKTKLAIILFAIIACMAVLLWIILLIPGETEEKHLTGEMFVSKIIDGDTVIAEGESVRLLGIDADEKGYPCYSAAKERIEELVLNKEVKFEADAEDMDQYGRYLRYIFLEGKNINLQLVQEGLAVARFYPENTKYKQEIIDAEKQARENKTGCKWQD